MLVLAFDLEAEIPAIAAPTLVIATRDDVLVPSPCSATLAARLRTGRLTLLDHGGHACNITDPDRFDAMVRAFLSES